MQKSQATQVTWLFCIVSLVWSETIGRSYQSVLLVIFIILLYHQQDRKSVSKASE